MALYRFLFAPALLVVAVLAGPVQERTQPAQAEAARATAPARHAAPVARPAAEPLGEAVAAQQRPRRAPLAKRSR